MATAAPKRGKPKKNNKPYQAFWRWFFGNFFHILRKHGNAAMVWIGIGYCVHQASLAAIAYAGRTSNANIAVSLLANISFVWTTSIALSGVSATLYFRERNQHRKTRDRLTDRITELETRWDKQRTSSMLTPDGLTRKEDQ